MKADRKLVYDKYGGKCAYCGCELGTKWCVDHIEPIRRKTTTVGGYKHRETGAFANNDTVVDDSFHEQYEYVGYKSVPNGCEHPELDTVENSNPACFSCNHYKSTMTLEMFRAQIGKLVGRLNAHTTQYKIAKRYGLVQETKKPIVFYFETLTNT